METDPPAGRGLWAASSGPPAVDMSFRLIPERTGPVEMALWARFTPSCVVSTCQASSNVQRIEIAVKTSAMRELRNGKSAEMTPDILGA